MEIKERIIQILKNCKTQYLSEKQLASAFGNAQGFDKQLFLQTLDEMLAEGELYFDKRNNRYRLSDQATLFQAEVEGNARGFAFLRTEDGDFFVAPSNLSGALHKDVVLARRVANTTDEATVVKIVSRGMQRIVGTVDKNGKNCFVIPDETKFCKDVFVTNDGGKKLKDGQKVVCKIVAYPLKGKPEGEIETVLGYGDEHNVDMLSVAYAYGISPTFPPNVIARAEKIPQTVEKSDMVGRLDLRSEMIFTIDGADAKDLDDAVSIAKTDGGYLLGVHIADVSHYVKPGSDIDVEAFNRGNSVYLPETVFPMLPTELSNGICSLYCGVDRLTLSCIMTIDGKGKVVDYQVAPSVINSKHRFTYDEVQAIFDGDEKLSQKYSDALSSLKLMKDLAEILTEKRNKKGNIDFAEREVTFVYDEQGDVTDVLPYVRTFAHKLIEEFMIVANETVAEYVSGCSLPFVFRVHDKPDVEKLQVLRELLKSFGILLNETGDVHATSLAKALHQAEGKPYFNLVNDVMLRSMQKAKYSTQNVGHFGLGSSCYCHFTSPIRRYADLVVHRVVKTLVLGKMTDKAISAYEDMCSCASVQASKTERNADEAERKADDVKKCRFAQKLIGKQFDGIVSGVTENGIFVELPNTVEGFVWASDLASGKLYFDKLRYTLFNDAVTYRLGDEVCVEIESVNNSACKIDMILAKDKNLDKKRKQ